MHVGDKKREQILCYVMKQNKFSKYNNKIQANKKKKPSS